MSVLTASLCQSTRVDNEDLLVILKESFKSRMVISFEFSQHEILK